MRHTFWKTDLRTGDIVEMRNGERGIVVLEKDCIVHQAGGLDCMEVFTEDLFVDGPQREGDIFKVYRDPSGPLGFNKLFGLEPVFVRKNDKAARERANMLNDKHDMSKGRVAAVVFEPCFRRCEEVQISTSDEQDLDIAMSEAPSMTVCGELAIDRTFIRVPGCENLFVVYNRYQEDWHLDNVARHRANGLDRESKPVVVIPERKVKIHSRCLLVRQSEDGRLENLRDGDFGRVQKYLYRMKMK